MIIIKEIIDLSWPMSNSTPIYPGDPVPNVKVFSTIKDIGYNLSSIYIGTQTGTHVDAPYHFIENSSTIDKIPLNYFFNEAVIIDFSYKKDLDLIDTCDLDMHEKKIMGKKIVLLMTCWDKYIGTERFIKHPYLSVEACTYLNELGVKFICIDTLNLDKTYDANKFPVHEYCALNNIMIGENMTNFSNIKFENPIIAAFPMNLIGCDGSPVRAVAINLHYIYKEKRNG